MHASSALPNIYHTRTPPECLMALCVQGGGGDGGEGDGSALEAALCSPCSPTHTAYLCDHLHVCREVEAMVAKVTDIWRHLGIINTAVSERKWLLFICCSPLSALDHSNAVGGSGTDGLMSRDVIAGASAMWAVPHTWCLYLMRAAMGGMGLQHGDWRGGRDSRE